MKKTVLSLAFLSIFAGNAIAQESNENENVLNNVLQQLLKSEQKPVKKEIVDNKLQNSNATKPTTITNKDEVKAVIVNVESEPELVEIVEQPNMKLVQDSELSDLDVKAIMEGNMVIQDINTSEKELNTAEETNEHFFLLNVPVETKLRANVDLVLPPFREKIAYHNGKSTSTDPFEYTSKATFCYLNLEKSGVWRRFKSEDNKYLNIISNVSNKKLYQYNSGDNREVLTVYETVFTFDNEHIKNLVCKSSEKELPLKISDLNQATGNLFSFEITPMLDI